MARRMRILAVDDDENVVRLLQIYLGMRGYEVVPAYDGEAALRQVAEQPPDLVLLDVIMPKADGYEVLQRLKADPKTASIPVVMLTARSQFEDLRTSYDEGAYWHLGKPFHVAEVGQFVRDILENVGRSATAPGKPC